MYIYTNFIHTFIQSSFVHLVSLSYPDPLFMFFYQVLYPWILTCTDSTNKFSSVLSSINKDQ